MARVASPRGCLKVTVVKPYQRDHDGPTFQPGRLLCMQIGEYRRVRSMQRMERILAGDRADGSCVWVKRSYAEVKHWSGRAYFHAVTCGGRLICPGDSRPAIVREAPREAPPEKARRIVVDPSTIVARAGCGCGRKRRRRARTA